MEKFTTVLSFRYNYRDSSIMPEFGGLLRPAYVHLTNVGRKSVKFVLPRLHCVWIMGDELMPAIFVILRASYLAS